jgi:Fic family protein
MFTAKYTITNKILRSIGLIDASREVISNAPLIPAWEMKFRKDAITRQIHHGTRLEGNPLSEEQVQDVLDGKEVLARDRDIQEILNYRNVLKYLDYLAKEITPGNKYQISTEIILAVHKLTVDRILPEDSSGHYRTRQVVIRNTQTGVITYTPPPALEVPFLMDDLIMWLKSPDAEETHPIIKAGVLHYEIARIHPFVDGNGRTARALATLIMFLEGYDIRKFFALEEYFDNNPLDYYTTLQTVSNQLVVDTNERDLTPWLEYFTHGVAAELSRVKERVMRISSDARVKDKLGEQVELNERQMMIMEYLHRHKEMKNSDFRKIFPEYSDDTVLREIKFLKDKGLVKKVGGTKKATYVLK